MSRIGIVITLLMTLIVVSPSLATTYYVSNSTANSGTVGSDSNNGTSWSTPWLTIAHAAATCSSGDTIYINTGKYAESSGSGYLAFGRAFTSPTTFQTYTGLADVTVTGSSSASDNVVFKGGGSYVTLKNINFTDRINTNSYIFRCAGSFSNLTISGGMWTILLNNDSIYRSGIDANYSNTSLVLSNISISGVTVSTSGTQGTSYTTAMAFGSTGSYYSGVALSGNSCSGVTLADDTISGVGIGVSLQGAIGVNVTACSIVVGPYGSWPTSNSTYGALVGQDGLGTNATTTATFTNDYISGAVALNGVYTSHGIILGSGATNCSITSSQIVSGNQGIVLKDCFANTVEWNSIYNMDAGAIVGLYFKGASHCVGEYNAIFSSYGTGIKDSYDPSGNLSSYNIIEDNSSTAVGPGVVCYYFGPSTEDSGGTLVNYNTYDISYGGTCTVNGTTGLTTLAGIQAAYGSYSPSGNDSASTVVAAPTTVSTIVTSSSSPSVWYQPVTFATIVAGDIAGTVPTGTVSATLTDPAGALFSLGASTLNSAGTAQIGWGGGVQGSVTGNWTLNVVYSGDPNYPSSTETLTQVVNKASTATGLLSGNANPTYGQTVNLTATVTDTTPSTVNPSAGTVQFFDGAAALGSSMTNGNGVATLAIASLSAGTHSLTAQFTGDNCRTSSVSSLASITVGVAPTSTTLTSTLNPCYAYENITLSAAVSGVNPTGSVTFTNSTTNATLGTVPLSGNVATLICAFQGTKPNGVTATYSGDANNASSVSNMVVQTVLAATPSNTTASISGPQGSNGWYTGQVIVTLAASQGSLPVVNTFYTIDGGSQETYSLPFIVSGDSVGHVVTSWSVDSAGNSGSTNTLTIKIDGTAPTLTFGAASPSAGSAGWYNASVSLPYMATDATSGVATVTPGSPLTFFSQGPNQTQLVIATDNAGNTETFTSPAVSIDLTPPVTTESGAAAGIVSASAVTITLSSSDNLSGVASTYYTIDCGIQQTYSAPFTVTGSGSNTVTYWSVDNAGNIEAAHALTFTLSPVKVFTSATVSPATATVVAGSTLQYTAIGYDQFGNVLAPQPTFSWTASGGGSIDPIAGLFTAGAATGGPFTVTATSGSISAPAQVTVSAFALAAIPATLSMNQGASGSASIGLTDLSGFNAPVTLISSSLPSGITASFSPATLSTGASTLTFTVSPTAVAGTYAVIVTGTSGSLNETTTVTLVIATNPILTTATVTPAAATVVAGSNQQFTATGYDQFGNVLAAQPIFTWTATGGGVIDPVAGVYTAGAAAGGPYTVTATSGSVVTTSQVTVSAFALAATPSTVTGNQGSSESTVVGVTDIAGFAGTVAMTNSVLPSGVTTSFSPAFLTNGSSTLTFTISPTTAAGTYQVTVTGTSGSLTESTTVTLVVSSNPILSSASVSPTTATVVAGSTQQFTATGYDQFGNPLSSQSPFTWTATGGGAIDPVAGVYTSGATAGGPFTVTATNGSVSATAQVAVSAFAIAPTPSTVTVNQGAAGSTSIGLTDLSGFAGTVTLTSSTLPAGVTASFSPASLSTGTAALTFTVSPTTAPATYSLTITGTSGSLTETTPVTLIVALNQILTTAIVSPATATVVAGSMQLYTATGYDQFGNALATQPTFGWSVTGGGTIASSGLFSSGTIVGGPFVVTATSGAVSASASASITAPLSGPTTIAAPAITVAAGSTALLTATLTTTSGSVPISGKTISFGVVGVTAGTAMTNAAGVATCLVTIGSGNGNWSSQWYTSSFAGSGSLTKSNVTAAITVTSIPVTVTVPTVTATLGQSVTLSATMLSTTGGFLMSNRTITFSIDGKTIGAGFTNSSGVGTLTYTVPMPTPIGNHTISVAWAGDAHYLPATGTGVLAVSAPPVLTSIAVSPSTATVFLNATQQLTAIAYDQNGNALTSQPVFSWAVTGGGTVSAAGLFVATAGGGPYTVTASSGAVTGTANVTVSSFTLSASPTTATVNQGATGSASIALADFGGCSTAVSLSVAGLPNGVAASFSPSSLTSGSSQLALAVSPTATAGSYSLTISGLGGGLTQTATVTLTVVSNPILTSVAATPSSVIMMAGTTQAFTATGYDQFGNALAVQPTFIWTVSGGGTISSAGVLSATAVGGPYMITAAASGLTATATATVTGPAATTVSASPISVADAQSTTLMATLTTNGTPLSSKTIMFGVNGVTVGTAVTNAFGVATASATIGNGSGNWSAQWYTATYGGSATYAKSSITEAISLMNIPSMVIVSSLSAAPGQSVTLSATLESASGGFLMGNRTITFSIDGQTVGTGFTNASGVGTLTYSIPTAMTAGSHTIAVTYNGDAHYLATSGSATLTAS